MSFKTDSGQLILNFRYPMAENCRINFTLQRKTSNKEDFVYFDSVLVNMLDQNVVPQSFGSVLFRRKISTSYMDEYKVRVIVTKKRLTDNLISPQEFDFVAVYAVEFPGEDQNIF